MTKHILTRLEHGRRWHAQWAIAISRYIATRHPHAANTGSGWIDTER